MADICIRTRWWALYTAIAEPMLRSIFRAVSLLMCFRALQRIEFAIVFAMGIALEVAPGLAQAQQKFPAKPIRLVVPATPGSTPDTLARMIGTHMSEALRQPVVIENRPGAAGVLASNVVAKAAPDGYTLLAVSPNFAVSAALQPSLPYDPLKDFSAVASIGFSTGALVVAPSLGVKSAKELIALGHARPGKILFGSPGAGSIAQMNAERFLLAAGMKAVHVGFKGQSEYIIEVVAGRVQFCVSGLGPALPLIKDGRLLLLAVNPHRTPLFPEAPALPEIFPGVGRDGSQMWLAPAGTPRAIIQQLNKEIVRILAAPEIRDRLQAVAFHIAPTTPEETDRMLRADIASFSKLVRDAGLRK